MQGGAGVHLSGDKLAIDFRQLVQCLFLPVSTEIVVNFKTVSQRIHLLVASPAVLLLSNRKPLTQRFGMILGNRGIHGNG